MSDKIAYANSVDPDHLKEQSDQGLHCLPLHKYFKNNCTKSKN